MTYVVTQSCVDIKDRSCVAQCPVDCIYEGDRMMYIHPDECIECGACEAACPVSAIYYDAELPPERENFLDLNAEFFTEIGSPRGAKKIGKTSNDPAFVSALPPGGA
ncbi:ferredoxin [Rhodococcus koreensis]|uniref:ferredoxin n=1 Tax=Rhodococcus koreensis TaxID=99653 RepID=UPI00366FF1A3